MAKNPSLVFWLVHDDGSHQRYTIADRHAVKHVYIGSDPANDVVLDDIDAERFHLKWTLVDETGIEVIVGLAWNVAGDTFVAGEVIERLPVRIGGWTLRTDPDPDNGAISIWRDALLEHRPEDAEALLASHGIARCAIQPHTPPEELVAMESRALVRVEGTPSVVYDFGPWRERPITLGPPGDYDLVLVDAMDASAQLWRVSGKKRRLKYWLSAQSGDVELLDGDRHRLALDEPIILRPPWQRIRVGGAIIQLCRFPARDERVVIVR